jgi:hypothetical protein
LNEKKYLENTKVDLILVEFSYINSDYINLNFLNIFTDYFKEKQMCNQLQAQISTLDPRNFKSSKEDNKNIRDVYIRFKHLLNQHYSESKVFLFFIEKEWKFNSEETEFLLGKQDLINRVFFGR